MVVRVQFSALNEGRWYEYVVRFLLGGAATLTTGIIAERWGPEIGGLFLAFPAILCASATLVEAHERREKREQNVCGHKRGTDAAAVEAAGAALGSVGLVSFGLAVSLLAPRYGLASLAFGSIAWLFTALALWRLRRIT